MARMTKKSERFTEHIPLVVCCALTVSCFSAGSRHPELLYLSTLEGFDTLDRICVS